MEVRLNDRHGRSAGNIDIVLVAYDEPLPGLAPPQRVVNVASVPQRSPFRYPGGKTWLVPTIRQWLGGLPARPTELIEPFAGGAIIGLTAAFESLADHVTLVERDEQIAAVWQTILSEEGVWLAHEIARLRLTPEIVEALLNRATPSIREQALQTIVRNRINRGGILAPGAGRLKLGEGGKGIASRWYPETLKKRILHITAIRQRFTFVHGDGLQVMQQQASRSDAVFFIDPPYTAAGKKAGTRLYTYSEVDHEELFRIAASLTGDFLMTYDETDEIHDLARQQGFDVLAIPMKNTHHARMMEFLIGRDLSWARPA